MTAKSTKPKVAKPSREDLKALATSRRIAAQGGEVISVIDAMIMRVFTGIDGVGMLHVNALGIKGELDRARPEVREWVLAVLRRRTEPTGT